MSIIIENRPWGSFEQFTLNEPSTVKILHVSRYKRLSKQYHHRRTEFWKILKGSVLATCNGKEMILTTGESLTIPRGAIHRLQGLDEEAIVLEISFGHFDESDIVRIEDDHGREAEVSDMPKGICVVGE